jgi:hypothetical protein
VAACRSLLRPLVASTITTNKSPADDDGDESYAGVPVATAGEVYDEMDEPPRPDGAKPGALDVRKVIPFY